MTDHTVSITERILPPKADACRGPLPAHDDSDHDEIVKEHLRSVDAYLAANAKQAEIDGDIMSEQPELTMEDDDDHDEFVLEHLRNIDSSQR
ncbi:hypothetical protein CN200_01630 [Sinorhizobium meliloti]|uniref:hypothetical protein n=1 Tax=Rhizobium meliloti TaxID=382 RepID=UPI000FD59F47|nr:hypothetical protein [Sinorhizobium meliloti]RVI19974.1 hypothetical protein CN200_01630 [Sinorhizobium meliloti]RVN91500.1 hypothetical protein CN107_07820 [Sinorhizobium meliloti]RVO15014.1 hypothetical protein CN103_06150 [Sinorhizobium meliloti]